MRLGEPPGEGLDTVGDVGPRANRRGREGNLAEVPLLGRALDVVRRFDYGDIQFGVIAVDVGKADFGGVLEGAVGLPPCLERAHLSCP